MKPILSERHLFVVDSSQRGGGGLTLSPPLSLSVFGCQTMTSQTTTVISGKLASENLRLYQVGENKLQFSLTGLHPRRSWADLHSYDPKLAGTSVQSILHAKDGARINWRNVIIRF